MLTDRRGGIYRISGLVLATVLVLAWAGSGGPVAAGDQPLGLPPVPVPEDNPVTGAKVRLGERLFKDERLSGDGTVSCASCHVPDKAFTDGRTVAKGIGGKRGPRNTPTILNAAYYEQLFWDGRRSSLEAQATAPLFNPVEHGLDSPGAVLQVLRQDPDYPRQFRAAFQVPPEGITMRQVGKAIAAYERTLVAGRSPFDRWWFDSGYNKMSRAADRGFTIFFSKAGCTNCHLMQMGGPTFTDNRYHNLGVGFDRIREDLPELARRYRQRHQADEKGSDHRPRPLTDRQVSELGRFAVTLEREDIGAFRTPSLRNVAATGPYMHDGSLKTLMEVVEFYNRGGNANPYLDSRIQALGLTERQKKDLVAFLRSLTSPEYQDRAEPRR